MSQYERNAEVRLLSKVLMKQALRGSVKNNAGKLGMVSHQNNEGCLGEERVEDTGLPNLEEKNVTMAESWKAEVQVNLPQKGGRIFFNRGGEK